MASFIFILVLCAFWHFIYEGVITPSYRYSTRFKLFALRDKLRAVKIEKNNELNDDVFIYMDSSLSSIINYLSDISIYSFYEVNKAVKSNTKLMQLINNKRTLINDCQLVEIREIKKQIIIITLKTLIVNSGGVVFYLIPVALPLLILLGIVALLFSLVFKCKKWVLQKIENLSFAPEQQFEKYSTMHYIPNMA